MTARNRDHARTDLPAVGGAARHGTPCYSCANEPAVACQECMRAIALMFFGGVARHPEAGTTCRLCEAGAPVYCGACLISAVTEQRQSLRSAGGHADLRVGRDIG